MRLAKHGLIAATVLLMQGCQGCDKKEVATASGSVSRKFEIGQLQLHELELGRRFVRNQIAVHILNAVSPNNPTGDIDASLVAIERFLAAQIRERQDGLRAALRPNESDEHKGYAAQEADKLNDELREYVAEIAEAARQLLPARDLIVEFVAGSVAVPDTHEAYAARRAEAVGFSNLIAQQLDALELPDELGAAFSELREAAAGTVTAIDRRETALVAREQEAARRDAARIEAERRAAERAAQEAERLAEERHDAAIGVFRAALTPHVQALVTARLTEFILTSNTRQELAREVAALVNAFTADRAQEAGTTLSAQELASVQRSLRVASEGLLRIGQSLVDIKRQAVALRANVADAATCLARATALTEQLTHIQLAVELERARAEVGAEIEVSVNACTPSTTAGADAVGADQTVTDRVLAQVQTRVTESMPEWLSVLQTRRFETAGFNQHVQLVARRLQGFRGTLVQVGITEAQAEAALQPHETRFQAAARVVRDLLILRSRAERLISLADRETADWTARLREAEGIVAEAAPVLIEAEMLGLDVSRREDSARIGEIVAEIRNRIPGAVSTHE